MILFSQKDRRWTNRTIGKTKLLLGRFGCLITSIGMLVEKRPDEVNDTLTRNNCFSSAGELYCDQAAKVFGREYEKTLFAPDFACIAETDHFAKEGYLQHFFVYLTGSNIADPLDGKIKLNPYNIVSYRIFKENAVDKC